MGESLAYGFLISLLEMHQDNGRHCEKRSTGKGDLGAAGGHRSDGYEKRKRADRLVWLAISSCFAKDWDGFWRIQM